MREEYELEVLEKYDLEVKGTRKMRGAFFCDTNEGTMLLRETKLSEQRALFLYQVLRVWKNRAILKLTRRFLHRKAKSLPSCRTGADI